MKTINPISRRAILRGIGTTLCLPLLESFSAPLRAATTATAAASPKRMVFLSYGWGVAKDHWFPEEVGPDYKISTCLEPLARHKKDFSVLSNLSNKRADGGHWGTTTWLTSADVHGVPGKSFQNSVSVDQVAARTLGVATRFPSLELASSSKDTGYGPGMSLAWSASGNSIAGETSPVALFDRLFGAAETPIEERRYNIAHDRSVLDAVMADAKSMHRSISKTDREKIEGYFDSVRDIETRLGKAEEWIDRPKPKAPFERPAGKLNAVQEIELMYDLIAAAIQTDMTRVISYRQPTDGIFDAIGFKVLGHKTTHCTTDSTAYKASIARDQKQAELLAGLIDKLKAMKDPDGSTVFDNSLIAYGSGIYTNHMIRDTPTLIAGHGGGGMNQGQHYKFESRQTPLANLWLGMLNQAGVKADSFADSDGKLPGLFG